MKEQLYLQAGQGSLNKYGRVDHVANNTVKVNMEDIYLNRPLLMTTTNKTNKKKFDQETCFIDIFQPII